MTKRKPTFTFIDLFAGTPDIRTTLFHALCFNPEADRALKRRARNDNDRAEKRFVTAMRDLCAIEADLYPPLRVVHYVDGVVTETDLDQFNHGTPIKVLDYGSTATFPPEEVQHRARAYRGRAGYSLTESNCEHFSTWCRTGKWSSVQVSTVGRTAGLLALFTPWSAAVIAGMVVFASLSIQDLPPIDCFTCPDTTDIDHEPGHQWAHRPKADSDTDEHSEQQQNFDDAFAYLTECLRELTDEL